MEGVSGMFEYIWTENGKYYRALTDLTGKIVSRKEISAGEYQQIKEGEKNV